MNDNRMFFLSSASYSESLSQVNGHWPLCLQANINEAVFGGNVNSPGQVKGIILRVNI
jgi:hypothetical protein